MDCPICYAAEPSLTIRCGHSFCRACVTQWLTASKEEGKPGCPLCRVPINFRGLRKIEKKLADQRWENMYDEARGYIFESAAEELTDRLTEIHENPGIAPGLKRFIAKIVQDHAMQDVRDMENTFNTLKDIYGMHPEDILEELAEGTQVNYEREQKRVRQEGWTRDKHSERIHRRSPHMRIRR